MINPPTLVGFFLGKHDSNLICFHQDKIRYAKSERLLQTKHHRANLNFVIDQLKKWKISSIDGLAFSDGNRNGLGECPKDQLFTLCTVGALEAKRTFCLDHHFAHALSGWPLISTNKIQKAVVLDGRGDHGWRGAVFCKLTDPQCLYRESQSNMSSVLNEIGLRLNLQYL